MPSFRVNNLKSWSIAALLIAFALMGGVFCSEGAPGTSPAHQLETELGISATSYSQENNWACLPWREDDPCNADFQLEVLEKDGSSSTTTWEHSGDADVDCFYIYPTVDLSMTPGNHDDLSSNAIQRQTARIQMGPFSTLCRVFVPLYRQVTIGTYTFAEQNIEEGIFYFKKAFLDVASAFEYYLEHWNEGRPIILAGHSQGAQMLTYLLRKYFDRNEELRSRLILALPIGFSFFVPDDSTVGGSLENIPVCTSLSQTGCVIHFRSYQDGYSEESIEPLSRSIDLRMAEEGYLYKKFDWERDHLLCVNPATQPVTPPYYGVDINGNLVEDENLMVLEGFVNLGLLFIDSGPTSYSTPYIFRHRFSARCKKTSTGQEYLAISYLEPDSRSDPINLKSDIYLKTWLGLHLFDYNLTALDLLYHARSKISAYFEGSR